MAGALIGAGFGALITLLNLGGKGDWTLAVPGSVFNGALVGVIVGAIIREMWAKDQPAAKRGRVRTIVLGAGVAVILALVGLIFLMRS